MKTRICITLDADLIDAVKAQDLQISTLINLLLKAFLDPTVQYIKTEAPPPAAEPSFTFFPEGTHE